MNTLFFPLFIANVFFYLIEISSSNLQYLELSSERDGQSCSSPLSLYLCPVLSLLIPEFPEQLLSNQIERKQF
jgi:hypothetical protein